MCIFCIRKKKKILKKKTKKTTHTHTNKQYKYGLWHNYRESNKRNYCDLFAYRHNIAANCKCVSTKSNHELCSKFAKIVFVMFENKNRQQQQQQRVTQYKFFPWNFIFVDVYYDCVGENWHLLNRGEGHAIQYLDQINGILSIRNEKNELLWYVRGKTLNGEKRGQIYRPNYQPKSSDFDLSTNPHGNAPNTCTPYNDYDENNNNNFRNARTSNYNNYNNNMRKVDRNNNGYNGDINGNYGPRNGKQLVLE